MKVSIGNECIKLTSDVSFEVFEEDSFVIIKNPNQLQTTIIKVDGCVLTTARRRRCDYLVNVSELDRSVLIELKGSNIDHAYSQLESTQHYLSDHIFSVKHWIISYSGQPRTVAGSQNLIVKAGLEHDALLVIEQSPVEHLLESI